MKKLFSFLLFTVALLPLLTACSEDISETFHYKQSLTIKVSDRNAASATRAIHNDFVTFFTDGDEIGLFATDENGKVIAANIKATLKNNEWNLDDDIKASEKYTYYAYFPWTDNPTNSPELNSSLTSNEPDVTFKEMIDAWPILIDQSSEKNYQKSDLLLAKGIYSDGILSFAMEHKMALAVWEGIQHKNINQEILYTPLLIGNKRIFVCKPNTAYAFNNRTVNFPYGSKYYSLGRYIIPSYNSPLTFRAIEDGTFSFSKDGLSYSLDGGETWTELPANTQTPTVKAGESIMWINNTEITPTSSVGIGTFSSTNSFDAEGNVMSLLYGMEFLNKTDLTGKDYAFYGLFRNNTKITNAVNLSLPATVLSNYCYSNMFYGCCNLNETPKLPATKLAEMCYSWMFSGCTLLKETPELPATELTKYCYSNMFNGCTSLIKVPELPAKELTSCCYYAMFKGCESLSAAPELPATKLAFECYAAMFYGCKKITDAPELPATTLANNCYEQMFLGCKALTTAPKLPATELVYCCYRQMFHSCTSLVNAPELPAIKLASQCYQYMFYNCNNLQYIKAAFLDLSNRDYLTSWVADVAGYGTFVKNADATWDKYYVIPGGWKVETYNP